MKTTQLKCPSCGSTELEKLQWNEYRCAHCNSTLKLDSEGKRLELTGWVCPQCSFNNPPGQRFCSKCGAKLVRACPRCKAENPLDAQFCGSCGFDYTLRAEWEELQWELGRLQSELDKLMEEQTSLKARKGRSARRSLERVSSRVTQLRLEISELEKTGATPASLREWTKKREEERPHPTTSRGIMQWFKRQDALVKTFIMGFGFVALLFLCIIGFALITPTPQTDPTSKYAREYETTAAQRDVTRTASAPTSVTTPSKKPTSTQEPAAPTISAPAATTPETSTPKPTPTSTQEPTSIQKPTTTPTPEHTPTPIVYVVKAGDTLSAISKEFGVTVEALQEANAISDPNQIQVGQELIIPKGGAIVPRGTTTEVKPTVIPIPPRPTAPPLTTQQILEARQNYEVVVNDWESTDWESHYNPNTDEIHEGFWIKLDLSVKNNNQGVSLDWLTIRVNIKHPAGSDGEDTSWGRLPIDVSNIKPGESKTMTVYYPGDLSRVTVMQDVYTTIENVISEDNYSFLKELGVFKTSW